MPFPSALAWPLLVLPCDCHMRSEETERERADEAFPPIQEPKIGLRNEEIFADSHFLSALWEYIFVTCPLSFLQILC